VTIVNLSSEKKRNVIEVQEFDVRACCDCMSQLCLMHQQHPFTLVPTGPQLGVFINRDLKSWNWT